MILLPMFCALSMIFSEPVSESCCLSMYIVPMPSMFTPLRHSHRHCSIATHLYCASVFVFVSICMFYSMSNITPICTIFWFSGLMLPMKHFITVWPRVCACGT